MSLGDWLVGLRWVVGGGLLVEGENEGKEGRGWEG